MSTLGEPPARVSPVGRLAASLKMTEGQAYTLVLGLLVAVTTAAIGIPPTLRDRVAPLAQSRPAAAAPSTADDPGGEVTEPDAGQVAAPELGSPAIGSPPASGDVATGVPSSPSSPAPTGPPTSGADGPADGGSLGDVEFVTAASGGPRGIAVDPATGGFFVATSSNGVVRYAASGSQRRTYPVDGELTGVHLEGERLVVLDGAGGNVLELDTRSGDVRTLATVTGTLPTDQPLLHDVVRSRDGDLLVSDAGQGVIWQVGSDGAVEEWYRGPELLSADGAGPAGMAIDGAGDVVLAVGRSALALTGAVYRIPRQDDGSAGVAEPVYRSLPDAGLTGLALGSSGRIYVASAGTDALLVLAADGTEIEQVTSDAFDGPFGLAFRGESLLVTSPSGVIARAAVEDRAGS